jgi:hypothetical protein
LDPTPYAVSNFVDGKVDKVKTSMDIPWSGIPTNLYRSRHQADEIAPFLESLRRSARVKHNPLRITIVTSKYGEIRSLASLELLMETCDPS